MKFFGLGQKKNKDKVEEDEELVDESNPARLLHLRDTKKVFVELFQSEHKDPEMFLKSAALISIFTNGKTKVCRSFDGKRKEKNFFFSLKIK